MNRAQIRPLRLGLQRGLTMVELLVALVVSMLISLAAISALTVTRQGFNTVDAASQLRDNGRFAADLIQRLAVQSGFKDVAYAARPATAAETASAIEPDLVGLNNALSTMNNSSSSNNPLDSYTTRTTGSLGYGSDILVMRYQDPETFDGSGVSDQSMIDCLGNSSSKNFPTNRGERMISVIHVAESPQNSGELALMCTKYSYSDTAAAWTISDPQPIVQGVENFQVLYGTDGVTPNASPTAATDTVPDRYLRADQMTVASNTTATNANWRRVRSLRIGLVLRGPANSAQEKSAQTLYPEGSVMSSSSDPGTIFSAPADGRLRQVLTFTVHLRNEQAI